MHGPQPPATINCKSTLFFIVGIKHSLSSGSTGTGNAKARSRRQFPPSLRLDTVRPATSINRVCTSSRLHPDLSQISACCGLMATTISDRACMFHDPIAVMVSAIPRMSRSGSSLTSSQQKRGDSTIAIVKTFSSALYPLETDKLSQGLYSEFSVKQYVKREGIPNTVIDDIPGSPAPMFMRINRIARPIEAFALNPGPKQPLPP